MTYFVKVDGKTVKGYDNQEEAELHANSLNIQIRMYGKEAYVEDWEWLHVFRKFVL